MAAKHVVAFARPLIPVCCQSLSTAGAWLVATSYPYPLVCISQPDQKQQVSRLLAGAQSSDPPVRLAFSSANSATSAQDARIIGLFKRKDDLIMPQCFTKNHKSWPVVQWVLEKHAHEGNELVPQAAFQKTGRMNIANRGNLPPLGHTTDAEDILESILAENKCYSYKVNKKDKSAFAMSAQLELVHKGNDSI